MKRRFDSLRALAQRARQRTRHLLLVPVVAVMASPAFAELPTMPAPGVGIGGTTPTDGDWLNVMGAWMKAGLTIFALVLVAMGFMYVMMGALGRWRAYSMGRAEMGDLKEYIIMGAVLAVFLVVIATYAIKTLA